MSKEATRCRTYKYRLHPTYRQTQSLLRQLDYQREIYNAALEERIGVWKKEKRSISYFEQCRTLTELREVRPEVLSSGIRLCRGTLKRLDRAFLAFYRRVQSGEAPGFPRFKSASRFPPMGRHWKLENKAGSSEIVSLWDWRRQSELSPTNIGHCEGDHCQT